MSSISICSGDAAPSEGFLLPLPSSPDTPDTPESSSERSSFLSCSATGKISSFLSRTRLTSRSAAALSSAVADELPGCCTDIIMSLKRDAMSPPDDAAAAATDDGAGDGDGCRDIGPSRASLRKRSRSLAISFFGRTESCHIHRTLRNTPGISLTRSPILTLLSPCRMRSCSDLSRLSKARCRCRLSTASSRSSKSITLDLVR
mmetsp:Transcript_10714/g.25972  ORF Transcript_10714/g.25972 Transcript_10714/m.25972 type:complete len:203 (+) Transcript_10714:33-641(+)